MVSDRPNRGNPIRPVSANAIAHRGFSSSFRGFDPVEVREFLGQVATEVDALQRRVAELETALAEQATMAAAAADQPVEQVRPQPLSAEDLMAQVGEQTATVLRSAHAAAADITARAESEAAAALEQANSRAAHILDEAQARSAQVLAEAEPIAARIREEAETGAARLREGAEREVEGLLARAREQAESIRNQAEQERRLTVEGAQSVREKILSDLSRRRRVATVQIEQLRAGRERLLESYGVVRRTLEEVADELLFRLSPFEPRPVDVGARRFVPLDETLLGHDLEKLQDGRVSGGGALFQRLLDLPDRGLAEVPQNPQNLELRIGRPAGGRRVLRHAY
ncbi:MAG: hypothetical protein DLM65_09550, partial [Candidatus Aeolococcus gillhamiae]